MPRRDPQLSVRGPVKGPPKGERNSDGSLLGPPGARQGEVRGAPQVPKENTEGETCLGCDSQQVTRWEQSSQDKRWEGGGPGQTVERRDCPRGAWAFEDLEGHGKLLNRRGTLPHGAPPWERPPSRELPPTVCPYHAGVTAQGLPLESPDPTHLWSFSFGRPTARRPPAEAAAVPTRRAAHRTWRTDTGQGGWHRGPASPPLFQ